MLATCYAGQTIEMILHSLCGTGQQIQSSHFCWPNVGQAKMGQGNPYQFQNLIFTI